MSTVPPPLGQRLRFWVLAMRPSLEHRDWVYERVTAPGYLARRRLAVVALQLVFVVIPQGAFAIAARNWWRGIAPAAVLLLFVGVSLSRRSLTPVQQQRLLAYYGLTLGGGYIPPQSAVARNNPLGRTGLALFCVQVLVVASGAALVFEHRIECHGVPAASVAAIRDVIGVPPPGAAFGIPSSFPWEQDDGPPYDVAAHSPLVSAREVGTVFRGMHYVAAYVRGRDGRLIGPGVWRVTDPGTTFQLPTIEVSALDADARRLSPNSGAAFSSPPDRQIGQARGCARWAH